MRKQLLVLVASLAMVALFFNSAMATIWTPSIDEFADSASPLITSVGNYPSGRHLWSGHQGGNEISYTLLQFDLGVNSYESFSLFLFVNGGWGQDGTTKIWLNPNNNWGGNDVYWDNLSHIWDYTSPILVGEKNIPGYGWTSFDLPDMETSILSLVIGSILPNQAIPTENYWRDFPNLQFSPECPGIILEGTPSTVPEPGTLVLLGAGLIALSSQIRRRKSA